MADEPKTPQWWAKNYLKHRFGKIKEWLRQSKIPTFSSLEEGKLFIRFPWFRVENGELVFKNTELYRKIRPVRYVDEQKTYSAIRVITGSFHEIPDNEPVIVIR